MEKKTRPYAKLSHSDLIQLTLLLAPAVDELNGKSLSQIRAWVKSKNTELELRFRDESVRKVCENLNITIGKVIDGSKSNRIYYKLKERVEELEKQVKDLTEYKEFSEAQFSELTIAINNLQTEVISLHKKQ